MSYSFDATYDQISKLARKRGCSLPEKRDGYDIDDFLTSQKASAVRGEFYNDQHGWRDIGKISLKTDADVDFIMSLCATMIDYATGARKIDMYLSDVAKALIYTAVSTAVIDPYKVAEGEVRRNMFKFLYKKDNKSKETGWEEFDDLKSHLASSPSVLFDADGFKKPITKKDPRSSYEVKADLSSVSEMTTTQIKAEWLKLISSVFEVKEENGEQVVYTDDGANLAVMHKLCFVFACTALRLSIKEDYLVQTSFVSRMRETQSHMIPTPETDVDLKFLWPTHDFFSNIKNHFAEKSSNIRPMFVVMILHQWFFENTLDQALDESKSSNQAIIEASILTTASLHGMQMVKAFQTLLSTSELNIHTLMSSLNNEQFTRGLDALMEIWILCFAKYTIGYLMDHGGEGETPLNSPILNGDSRAGSFIREKAILKHRFALYARAIDPTLFDLGRGETDVRMTVSLNYATSKMDKTSGIRRSAFMIKNERKFLITARWYWEQLDHQYMNQISSRPAPYNVFRSFLDKSRLKAAQSEKEYQDLIYRATHDDQEKDGNEYGKEYISAQELKIIQQAAAAGVQIPKKVSFSHDPESALPLINPKVRLPPQKTGNAKELPPLDDLLDLELDDNPSDEEVYLNESIVSKMANRGNQGNPSFSKPENLKRAMKKRQENVNSTEQTNTQDIANTLLNRLRLEENHSKFE